MPIFNKSSKKSKNESQDELDNLPPVKQLDKRLGMESYRDFFTLKNYWKTVSRKSKDAECLFMYRLFL